MSLTTVRQLLKTRVGVEGERREESTVGDRTTSRLSVAFVSY